MKTCTFFGHADASFQLSDALKTALIPLIETQGVTRFLVGNHGNFDTLVAQVLCHIQKQYPHIHYAVVLAYLSSDSVATHPTLFPEGIERTPHRFAIDFRNRWMLKQSDFVITHVTRGWGGAAKFKTAAETQHKTVINLP